MGDAIRRLGGSSRRSVSSAATAAAALLNDGEMVELALACRFRGEDAVAVLTNQRLLLVNSREWSPEVVEVKNLTGLSVEGWVDRRAATVRISSGEGVHVIDRAADTDVAGLFTAALRARAGA